eukprot:scaffold25795_cov51-Phaeocystis_antarctica.AAC.5
MAEADQVPAALVGARGVELAADLVEVKPHLRVRQRLPREREDHAQPQHDDSEDAAAAAAPRGTSWEQVGSLRTDVIELFQVSGCHGALRERARLPFAVG